MHARCAEPNATSLPRAAPVTTPPWWASTCSRSLRAFRWKSNTPRSFDIAIRRWIATRLSLRSPNPAKRPTRWPLCANRNARDITRLPCATLSAAPSLAKPMAASICTPARKHVNNMLYLRRQYLYPVALEGALKLKETSYIHAEGYPAAEWKHGPIALVDEQTPSVFLIPSGGVVDKIMSNLEEIKARGGPVIAICSEADDEVLRQVYDKADDVIA